MGVKQIQKLSLVVCMLAMYGCANQGGGTMMSGSAGGATSVDANKSLEHCASPLGTLAVDDGRYTGTTSVTTVDPLIRLAVQQSNCFVITSIGNSRTDANLERITGKQRDSGNYRAGSKQHKGQAVAADYLLEPVVVIDNETNGSIGGALAGVGIGAGLGALGLHGVAPVVSAVSGGMESKTTEVALTLTDIRSTVQVGISQGTASTSNFAGSMGGWGGLLGGAVGVSGFTRTPEGKATAAAFFDAYNNLVQALRNYKAQDVKGGLGRGGALKVN